MTFEYSGDPATSAKDEVRFLIGDTDENDALMQDEEIDYLVTTHGSVSLAGANALLALASRYSRQVTKAVGDLKLELSDKAAQFRVAADDLFAASGGSGANVPAVAPYVGGLSIAEKVESDADPDLVRGSFSIGMHDFEGEDEDHGRRRDSDYGTVGS